MVASLSVLACNELAVPISAAYCLDLAPISCKGRRRKNLLHPAVASKKLIFPKPFHHQFIVIGLVDIVAAATFAE